MLSVNTVVAPDGLTYVLDAETVRLHHGKHHAAYVAGANSAAAQLRLISLAGFCMFTPQSSRLFCIYPLHYDEGGGIMYVYVNLLIQSGGGTGPMKPGNLPIFGKVLIPDR